jgi:hypothetical protein
MLEQVDDLRGKLVAGLVTGDMPSLANLIKDAPA